jgi:hypothetical protein
MSKSRIVVFGVGVLAVLAIGGRASADPLEIDAGDVNQAGSTAITLTALENGFVVPSADTHLQVTNNTGAAITGFTLVLKGTGTDTLLTCRSSAGVFTNCSIADSSGHSKSGTAPQTSSGAGGFTVGATPWTFTWSGGSIANGATFQVDFRSVPNTDALTTTAVPEPATLLLLGSGLAAAGAWARRRRLMGVPA